MSSLNVSMKGLYRLRTINKFSGKITSDTGWFNNVLLTSGMNEMANQDDWIISCQVGTDGTVASSTDTALLGWVAGTSDVQSTVTGQQGIAPYYGWKRRTFRFAIGTVAANLSEVGVGWGESGSTLVSRARILDPVLQVPTTITPLADEFLEVLFELRYYPPLVDVVGPQAILNGVTYDTLTRASVVTDAIWSSYIGTKIGVIKNLVNWKAWDGAIGTILQSPSGNSLNCDTSNQYNTPYSNNSFELGLNCPVGSTGWNLGSGIRCIAFQTTAGEYQTQFTAVSGGGTIPKTNTYTLLMKWIINWGEKT